MSDIPHPQSIDTELEALRGAHRALDLRILQMQQDGFKDQLEVQRLKKQKLALKDRIVRLESGRIPDIIA